MYKLFINHQVVFTTNNKSKYYEMYHILNQSSWYLQLDRSDV